MKTVVCLYCRKQFPFRRTTQKFCSQSCAHADKRNLTPTYRIDRKGYVLRSSWDGDDRVTVRVHRWVVEQRLRRKLPLEEDVHHLNGIKDDNRIENLEVIGHADHSTNTNLRRQPRRGYRLNLTSGERHARSERVYATKLWTFSPAGPNPRKARRGEANPSAKLSWNEVREIRVLSKIGAPGKMLMNRYAISRFQIRNILSGKHWKETSA